VYVFIFIVVILCSFPPSSSFAEIELTFGVGPDNRDIRVSSSCHNLVLRHLHQHTCHWFATKKSHSAREMTSSLSMSFLGKAALMLSHHLEKRVWVLIEIKTLPLSDDSKASVISKSIGVISLHASERVSCLTKSSPFPFPFVVN